MKLKLIKEEGELLKQKNIEIIRKCWHRLYQFLPSLSINNTAIDSKLMYFVMARQGKAVYIVIVHIWYGGMRYEGNNIQFIHYNIHYSLSRERFGECFKGKYQLSPVRQVDNKESDGQIDKSF